MNLTQVEKDAIFWGAFFVLLCVLADVFVIAVFGHA